MRRLQQKPGQNKPLKEVPRRSVMPDRGVYFFFESGEHRTDSVAPRVVRVGTHAVSLGSKSTLHGRLKQHLGPRNGIGNHRGSIFRWHVGTAMLVKEAETVSTWASGTTRPPILKADAAVLEAERRWEARVSEYLGALPVCWIAIGDEPNSKSDRGHIERNSIALLSNHLNPSDRPGPSWLGRFSPEQRIRVSGLWNLKHVDEGYDPTFLDLLDRYVDQ